MAHLVFLSLPTSPHTQTNHDGSSGIVLASLDVLYTQTSQPGSSGVLITTTHHFHTPDKLTRLVWCFYHRPLTAFIPQTSYNGSSDVFLPVPPFHTLRRACEARLASVSPTDPFTHHWLIRFLVLYTTLFYPT